MPVKPPAPKHTSQDRSDALIISIPSPKYWGMAFVQGLGLLWLLVVVLFLFGALLYGRSQPDQPPLALVLAVLVLFVGFGGFAGYQFAWLVSGQEVIEVTAESIGISRVALGIRSPREYLAEHIKDLRISSSNMSMNHPMLLWMSAYYFPWRPNTVGSLAFDYGAQTFRFGISIDEAEAKQILAEIRRKFPQYKH